MGMKSWAEMSGGARGGVVAGAAAVIAALFYGAWTVSRPPVDAVGVVSATGSGQEAGETPEAEAEVGEAVSPEAAIEAEAASEPDAVTDAATNGAADAVPETAGEAGAGTVAEAGVADEAAPDVAAAPEVASAPVAEVAPEVAPEGKVLPPSFDLVRVEKDGSALVAGSAMPDVMLSLRVTGEEIAAVPADGQGNFVAMFNLAPSEAPRVLSLVMLAPDGTEVPAEGTVVIAPTIAPVVVAEAVPDEPRETAMAEVGTPEAAPAPETEAQAPAALLVTEEGAKVLQSASDLPPELVANVTIDTITYTPEGAVQLVGRGTPERVVRLYLDNAPLVEAAISTAGDWAVTLPEVAPGIYTLRADQVDAGGAVTSRFETPFKRETVEALAAVAGDAAAEAAATAAGVEAGGDAGSDAGAEGTATAPPAPVSVTVQPGFTLWQIATERLGAGTRYVQVFEANRDQIRDPDLIYPGQVFAIPEAE